MTWAAVVPGVLLGALFGRLLNLSVPVLSARLSRSEIRATAETRRELRDSWWRSMRSMGAGTAGVVAVRPPILEALTAVLFALTVARFGLSWALPAYLFLAGVAVLLATIDVQQQRLPNLIVLPAAAAGLILLTLAALGSGSWNSLLRAVSGGILLFGVYLVLALISPAGMGMGDVKLAGVLGLYMGYVSWRALILGAVAGFVLAAVVGGVLLAARRVRKTTLIPFGPSMLLAALAAVLLRTS